MLEHLKLKTILSMSAIVLAVLILAGVILAYNVNHPLVFTITQCEIRDNTYVQHDRVFKTEICRTKEDGVLVHAYQTDTIHTFTKSAE